MPRLQFLQHLVLILILGSPLVACGQDTTLVDFEIKDQLDRVHASQEYSGQSVVVVGFDRKGSDYRDRWVSALRDSLRDSTGSELAKVLPVATLKGVPFFMKGFLKGKFPKDEDRWMLLDWKGRFTKAYDFVTDSCSFLIFDREGHLRYRAAGTELDFGLLEHLLECVRESDSLSSPSDDALRQN